MSGLRALGLMSAMSVSTHYVPITDDPGQRVALHCMAPTQPNGRSVLFVHGASFPTMLAFGFEFAPGDSWMGFMARQGFLACGLDFIGFGASSRPPQMANDAASAAPLTRATDAAREIALAVDYLRTEHGMRSVHLIAHSWGTMAATTFAATHPDALASLTLFGPIVPGSDKHDPGKHGSGKPAEPVHVAWWSITAEARYQQLRYKDVLPTPLSLLEPAIAQRWAGEFEASAPHVQGDPAGELRIPAGPVADIEAAATGSYPCDPATVKVPVFVVYGDYDNVTDDAGAVSFLATFTASPLKWRTRIEHGTHVMHLEHNRQSLYRSVDAFIRTAEALPP
ncbi:alpha/beta hydrolase [Dyella subtropica]|uniref:alpha/beta hydrolase n=1 Tax=Dyella subtropica TaxID=2992127 RepID=UPI00225A8E85|nr:alpha/beta fold hydrolase [Dyella subtropica]